MRVIHANCRAQFTAGDMDFITAVLGKKKESSGFLVSLLSDVETRDLILDDETLFRALLEQRGCLRVSPHLYFYVLVRHVLRQAGLDDRSVADYVAELLTEFSREERTRCVLRGQLQPMDYFFEMLTALQTADDYTAFCLRAHIGNHSLFFSGVFPDRIRARAERRGFPGLPYYREMGRASFRAASHHRLASEFDLAPIFDTLSARFEPTRLALNDLAERVFSIGDQDLPLFLKG
ncbi:MAG: hypothetical protein ABSA83_21115 [Verrucomicrobiota bacterium]